MWSDKFLEQKATQKQVQFSLRFPLILKRLHLINFADFFDFQKCEICYDNIETF